jgi:long-chain fatty acid transport protein
MFHSHHAHWPSLTAAGLLAGLCISSQTLASGFAVPEISTAGIGMANALVANPDERGAVPFNPAASAFHDDSWLSMGTLFISPSFSVKTASGNHDGKSPDWLIAPLFQGVIKLNDRWTAGLGLNAPFGLETRWNINTFPALTGSIPLPPQAGGGSIPASPQPMQSNLEILNFVPSVTYAFSDELAVSAGVDYYWVKSAELNSSITQLKGDGASWGFNLSAMYVKGPFSAGINFHSSSTIKVEGNYSALNPTMVLVGALQPSQTAALDLNLPWRLQLGARYQFTPKLAVEFDWNRTGWSEFDEIKVTGDVTNTTILLDKNDWEDANAYRLGMTYQLLDQVQLRFGYAYDETPQGDAHFSARVPDNDRHLFGVGVGHRLADGWQVEAGYMYVMFEDRDYRSSTPYLGGGEINGTNAINGDYSAHVHLFGLEVSKSF